MIARTKLFEYIYFFSRYVSVTKGFTYLKEMDYLDPLLNAWKEVSFIFFCLFLFDL